MFVGVWTDAAVAASPYVETFETMHSNGAKCDHAHKGLESLSLSFDLSLVKLADKSIGCVSR